MFAPPLARHSFGPALWGSRAIQHCQMLRSFSEFPHRVQDQLNAIPPEVHRHPAHGLDLHACDFYIFKQLRRGRKCHTLI